MAGTMKFRTRLLLISGLAVAGAVALVTGAVSISARRAFDRAAQTRRDALLDQFRAELENQGREIARKVERVASSQAMTQIAIEATRAEPDYSAWLNEAQTQAETLSLDFLDLLAPGGEIVSSAHWPARFGYRTDWVSLPADAGRDQGDTSAFLARIPTPEGIATGLIAVRSQYAGDAAGDAKVFAVGGRRLDAAFLSSLHLAPGARVFLASSPQEILGPGQEPNQEIDPPQRLAPLGALVEQIFRSGQPAASVIQWTGDRASSENFYGLPLARGGTVMGVLLVGNSLREQVGLERSILKTGLIVAASGILLGVLLGWWVTERVTRPVERLADGARSISSGDWNVRVEVGTADELGDLARAFNQMTEQLIAQHDRAIQAERVAAWRELARRLAHELKNPLFPLQITVENLQRARASDPAQFDEIFRESTGTLLKELAQLKTIIGRFSDFARMPAPVLEPVNVNEVVCGVMKLFDAQLSGNGAGKIEISTELEPSIPPVPADPEQLGRALRNLVLNAMDAMPEGGMLSVRTRAGAAGVQIEVSDSGQGLTAEECERLFTPYYTTKKHGTGLGLAIVQSVVSDHHGRISVASEPGKGATFVLDLPCAPSEPRPSPSDPRPRGAVSTPSA
jgi:two-component system, NtrC family, nitrogen regulation sensor histidine kinase NtrY